MISAAVLSQNTLKNSIKSHGSQRLGESGAMAMLSTLLVRPLGFIFAPDREAIDAVINKARQETETGGEDDLDSSSEKEDENDENDEEARLVAAPKKKKRPSWKDAGPLLYPFPKLDRGS
jgi:hypothetical protein